jgi:hypothetical protein
MVRIGSSRRKKPQSRSVIRGPPKTADVELAMPAR